jgi:drug/metabolite transporter (DMT)-like permease
MISKEHIGSLYAISSGFLYGFVGYFGVSVVHASLSVTNMLFWRFFIASAIMTVIVIARIKHVHVSRKEACATFINGALLYGLSTMLYFFACPYIGTGLAMVIFFTYPAMVMLLNHFLYGQKIPPIYYAAITIIIIGMALFVDPHEITFDLLGITLSVTSAFLYAGYMVASKKVATFSPDLSTLIICLGCMTTSLILSLTSHTFSVPTTWSVWFDLFGIGVVATTVPILLLLYSLNYISSEKASILSVLEPVFVLIFGVTLLGEPMKLQYLFGAIIVLSGALLTLFNQQNDISSPS